MAYTSLISPIDFLTYLTRLCGHTDINHGRMGKRVPTIWSGDANANCPSPSRFYHVSKFQAPKHPPQAKYAIFPEKRDGEGHREDLSLSLTPNHSFWIRPLCQSKFQRDLGLCVHGRRGISLKIFSTTFDDFYFDNAHL